MQRDRVINAIDKLFSDTSVSASETLSNLEYIREHVDSLIDTLKDEDVESYDE